MYTLGELRKSSEKKDIKNYQIAFEKLGIINKTKIK